MLTGKICVGVDIDGVLRDFRGSVDRVYSSVHPGCRINRDHREYSLWQRYPDHTPSYISDFVFRAYAQEIFLNADTIPGSQAFFKRACAHRGLEVGIITSQSKVTGPITLEWLGKNGFTPSFVFIVPFKKSKADVSTRTDILIDDKTENLLDFRRAGRRAICFAQEWNDGWDGERSDDFDAIFRSLLLEKC